MVTTPNLLIDIGIIVLCAAVLANVSKLFKQPLILGYVLAGILIGPGVFGLLQNGTFIQSLSELGIAFLLFIVGLELHPQKLKQVGSLVFVTAGLCAVFITALGLFVSLQFFGFTESLYLGLILAFSSTMIVIKLLSDEGQLNTLHGRIILGILLVQDILVIIALPLLEGLRQFNALFIGIALLKGLALFALSYLAGRFVLHRILAFTASHTELLFVTSLGVCFVFIAAAYYLGFSVAIGAFLAGIALSSSPYSVEVVGRIASLKDFFIVLFFVSLGSQLTTFSIFDQLGLLFILVLLVVLVKPLIFFILLKLFNQSNRTSFSSSMALGQISEFSLILAVQGFSLGHLSSDLFSLIILLGIITITFTPYMIRFDQFLFHAVSSRIERFDRRVNKTYLENLPKELSDHIVVIGAHRMGGYIIETLRSKRANFFVVDFNPEIIRKLIKQKIHCLYGDYGNIHVLESLHLKDARLVISTVPNVSDNLLLLNYAREKNKHLPVIVTAKNASDTILFYKSGATFVIYPSALAGQKVSDLLVHLDKRALVKWGKTYYQDLAKAQKKDPFMW